MNGSVNNLMPLVTFAAMAILMDLMSSKSPSAKIGPSTIKTAYLLSGDMTQGKKATILNQTINIDQGAVFGGELTAFRYPEKERVSVNVETDYSDGSHNPLLELEKKAL